MPRATKVPPRAWNGISMGGYFSNKSKQSKISLIQTSANIDIPVGTAFCIREEIFISYCFGLAPHILPFERGVLFTFSLGIISFDLGSSSNSIDRALLVSPLSAICSLSWSLARSIFDARVFPDCANSISCFGWFSISLAISSFTRFSFLLTSVMGLLATCLFDLSKDSFSGKFHHHIN